MQHDPEPNRIGVAPVARHEEVLRTCGHERDEQPRLVAPCKRHSTTAQSPPACSPTARYTRPIAPSVDASDHRAADLLAHSRRPASVARLGMRVRDQWCLPAIEPQSRRSARLLGELVGRPRSPPRSGPGSTRDETRGSADASASRRDDTRAMFPAPLPAPGSGDERARGVDIVECTIPAEMTIAQWRRAHSTAGERRHGPAHTPRGAPIRAPSRGPLRPSARHDDAL